MTTTQMQVPGDLPIVLTLTLQATQKIAHALGHMPFNQVSDIIHAVQTQGDQQVREWIQAQIQAKEGADGAAGLVQVHPDSQQ